MLTFLRGGAVFDESSSSRPRRTELARDEVAEVVADVGPEDEGTGFSLTKSLTILDLVGVAGASRSCQVYSGGNEGRR